MKQPKMMCLFHRRHSHISAIIRMVWTFWTPHLIICQWSSHVLKRSYILKLIKGLSNGGGGDAEHWREEPWLAWGDSLKWVIPSFLSFVCSSTSHWTWVQQVLTRSTSFASRGNDCKWLAAEDCSSCSNGCWRARSCENTHSPQHEMLDCCWNSILSQSHKSQVTHTECAMNQSRRFSLVLFKREGIPLHRLVGLSAQCKTRLWNWFFQLFPPCASTEIVGNRFECVCWILFNAKSCLGQSLDASNILMPQPTLSFVNRLQTSTISGNTISSSCLLCVMTSCDLLSQHWHKWTNQQVAEWTNKAQNNVTLSNQRKEKNASILNDDLVTCHQGVQDPSARSAARCLLRHKKQSNMGTNCVCCCCWLSWSNGEKSWCWVVWGKQNVVNDEFKNSFQLCTLLLPKMARQSSPLLCWKNVSFNLES